jgi:hypothetical protein
VSTSVSGVFRVSYLISLTRENLFVIARDDIAQVDAIIDKIKVIGER